MKTSICTVAGVCVLYVGDGSDGVSDEYGDNDSDGGGDEGGDDGGGDEGGDVRAVDFLYLYMPDSLV